jgi:hypothetical protein
MIELLRFCVFILFVTSSCGLIKSNHASEIKLDNTLCKNLDDALYKKRQLKCERHNYIVSLGELQSMTHSGFMNCIKDSIFYGSSNYISLAIESLNMSDANNIFGIDFSKMRLRGSLLYNAVVDKLRREETSYFKCKEYDQEIHWAGYSSNASRFVALLLESIKSIDGEAPYEYLAEETNIINIEKTTCRAEFDLKLFTKLNVLQSEGRIVLKEFGEI